MYGLRGVRYLIYDSTGDETVERRRNQETQVVYGTVHAEKLLAFPIWRNRNLTMQSQSGDAITDAITLVIASPHVITRERTVDQNPDTGYVYRFRSLFYPEVQCLNMNLYHTVST